MTLIDAIFINNGGGKILLDYLIEVLELHRVKVHYLLDNRVKYNHPEISENEVTYLKSGLRARHKFYKLNKNNFSKVLCFGNLPPSLRMKAEVFTYFHQKLFLVQPKGIPFKQKLVLLMKSRVLASFKKNTDWWMVQTEVMKHMFVKDMKIENKRVLIIPFFPPLTIADRRRNPENFIYVSLGHPHKNHNRLLSGFKKFYDKVNRGQLHLTIGDDSTEIKDSINLLIEQGYPIINHGFVGRDMLAKLYSEASFIIYPSLSESFGLGIIEAIENGCNVIGADMPYTYSVCNPSLVFNPLDVDSIADSFESAMNDEIPTTEQLVFNEINKLIALLN